MEIEEQATSNSYTNIIEEVKAESVRVEQPFQKVEQKKLQVNNIA